MPTTNLRIVCLTPPKSPLYLRWINRWGGWEYFMFQKRQAHSYSQSSIETFTPYITDYATALATEQLVSKEIGHTLTVGAQNLTRHQWDVLARIPQSPCVQYYNRPQDEALAHSLSPEEAETLWVTVLVDKCKVEMLTDDGRHSIELDLRMPAPQLAV